MRLWTVHPRYLDAKGVVALWREGLLARAVLHGKTRGYTNHPQLIRFKEHPEPLNAIDAYLAGVLAESRERGYRFDASKIDATAQAEPMAATTGQLDYEWAHLMGKLAERDPDRREAHKGIARPEPHPLFRPVDGPVEPWEKV